MYRDNFQIILLFFFQAEDGIRDYKVTGVQTCALPISSLLGGVRVTLNPNPSITRAIRRSRSLHSRCWRISGSAATSQIGRASCRERVDTYQVGSSIRIKRKQYLSRKSGENVR